MKTFVIFKKEIASFFNTPIAYIFLIIFLLIEGWFFQNFLFVEGSQASLRNVFGITPWAFCILIPAITMKLFAEEKKTGTIEILGTLPISYFSIIMGKFLAATFLLLISILSMLPYIITISVLGDPDGGVLFAGLLGLFFLGLALTSIGIMFSAFTKNQIVAFVLSFSVGISLFVVGMLVGFLPLFVGNFLSFISLFGHFENMTRGVIDSRDVIYFLSLIILPLFITAQTLIKKK